MKINIDKTMEDKNEMNKPQQAATLLQIVIGNGNETDEISYISESNENCVVFNDRVIPKITKLMEKENKNHYVRLITIHGENDYECYPLPKRNDVLGFINQNLSSLEIYTKDGEKIN